MVAARAPSANPHIHRDPPDNGDRRLRVSVTGDRDLSRTLPTSTDYARA